jgi:2-iminobutanoate/2-iminopropanoate deaminase
MNKSGLERINSLEAPQAIGPYSQAVRAGNLIFVSGQLPLDPSTGKLVEGQIHVHINQVLDNLEAILKSAGCSFKDVVRVDIFLKDLQDFGVLNEEYTKRFHQPIPPARQTIQVAKLPLDARIEISCIAALT